jgi:hypothetical protein
LTSFEIRSLAGLQKLAAYFLGLLTAHRKISHPSLHFSYFDLFFLTSASISSDVYDFCA